MEKVVPALEVRKILVKGPRGEEDAFKIFPFLVQLSEEFPKAEINVVCEEGHSLAYYFLPFRINAYERPKEKLSLLNTHHFCANLNDVFNVDLFFDLENSFNSSFIGFNFKATERVGYGVGWNKYFLNKRFSPELNMSLEKMSLSLLESYQQKKFPEVSIFRERSGGVSVGEIDLLFKNNEEEASKLILIMLDNFKNVAKQIKLWTSFFDSFENQKFIIWAKSDEDLISDLFTKVDLGKNSLYMHKGPSIKELIYIMNKVQGVVVNNIWAEGVANYFGLNLVSFLTEENMNIPHYHLYKFKPQRFYFLENAPIRFVYLEEKKEYSLMNEVVDHLHFYFKL